MDSLEKGLRVSKKGKTRHLIGSRLVCLSRRDSSKKTKQRHTLGKRDRRSGLVWWSLGTKEFA
jgi:hypothetical protein